MWQLIIGEIGTRVIYTAATKEKLEMNKLEFLNKVTSEVTVGELLVIFLIALVAISIFSILVGLTWSIV